MGRKSHGSALQRWDEPILPRHASLTFRCVDPGQTPDQADPGWYAGWTKFKTEFANAVSKFLKEEFANLKVTDFKLSYKIVTDRVGAELLRKVKEQNDQHLHMAEEWEKSEKKLLGESGTESGQEGGSSGTGDVPPGSSGASSTPRGEVFTLPRFPFIPVSVPADFVQDAGPSVAEGSSGSGKASVPPPDRTNISPAPAEVMDASSSALEARRQERTQAGGLAEKRRRW
jgi:hypothetical protein